MDNEALERNHLLIEASNALRLSLTDASCGRHVWAGRNNYPCNRLAFVADTPGANGGYIRHFEDGKTVRKMDLLPGNAYFMPKNIDLEFRFEDGIYLIAFHFNIEAFAGFDVFNGYRKCHQFKVDPESMEKIIEWVKGDAIMTNILEVRSLIMNYAARIAQITPHGIRHVIALKRKYAKIIERIELQPSARITVAELAEDMNMTRDSLSKSFSKDMGIPLKPYLEKYIIQKASEQLLYSGKKIAEISKELDFNNEYYFSKFFKKHKQLSPLKFRKMYADKNF